MIAPPLSKQVLAGTWTPERARLRPDEALAALEMELLLGDPASGLDPATRTVTTCLLYTSPSPRDRS